MLTRDRMLKWHYSNVEHDDRGVWETRGYACEIVAVSHSIVVRCDSAHNEMYERCTAWDFMMITSHLSPHVEHSDFIQWRFLTYLSEKERIDYLLHELPASDGFGNHDQDTGEVDDLEYHTYPESSSVDERSRLLRNRLPGQGRPSLQRLESERNKQQPDLSDEDPTIAFIGLNALEIAAIANAKKFLSQRVVQKIVNDIWSGHIVFWESLSVRSRKRAQVYNQR